MPGEKTGDFSGILLGKLTIVSFITGCVSSVLISGILGHNCGD